MTAYQQDYLVIGANICDYSAIMDVGQPVAVSWIWQPAGPRSTYTLSIYDIFGESVMAHNQQCTTGEYSNAVILLENVPYATMLILGATVIAAANRYSIYGWAFAGIFIVYGLLGSLWIILYLCPHCPRYDTKSCPCGYGLLAAKLRPKGNLTLFSTKFKQYIPMIVPLWIIPVLVGGVMIFHAFSWAHAILLGAFMVDAFVILPVLSKGHGCKNCTQRTSCPWMGRKV